MCHTIGLDGVSMIGQSEVKEAQGWADETVGWGDTQLRGCSYSFAPDKHRAPSGTGCVGWWVSGGTMYLEERYADMEACYLGGNLYKLHIWLHHLPLLVLFWISQPMHGVSLWRQQNGKKPLKKKRKKKKQMYNWSFVSLPYCVSFLTIHGVWDSFSSSSSSLHSESVHSILLKTPAQKGTNVPVQIVLNWESSWGSVGFFGVL